MRKFLPLFIFGLWTLCAQSKPETGGTLCAMTGPSCIAELFPADDPGDAVVYGRLVAWFLSDPPRPRMSLHEFNCRVDVLMGLAALSRTSPDLRARENARRFLEHVANPDDAIFWRSVRWQSPRHKRRQAGINYLAAKARLYLREAQAATP